MKAARCRRKGKLRREKTRGREREAREGKRKAWRTKAERAPTFALCTRALM